MSKIRVLSVDDSALMRQIMTEIINSHSDMEMVATAPDPLVARDLIKKFNPDVLTLDVEMPRMDGLDFLEKLMRLRPMPVVMVSSLTGKGSEVTLRALELGAIDFVTKPQLGIREGMLAYSEMIAEKVRTAAKASLAAHKPLSAPTLLMLFSSWYLRLFSFFFFFFRTGMHISSISDLFSHSSASFYTVSQEHCQICLWPYSLSPVIW